MSWVWKTAEYVMASEMHIYTMEEWWWWGVLWNLENEKQDKPTKIKVAPLNSIPLLIYFTISRLVHEIVQSTDEIKSSTCFPFFSWPTINRGSSISIINNKTNWSKNTTWLKNIIKVIWQFVFIHWLVSPGSSATNQPCQKNNLRKNNKKKTTTCLQMCYIP